MLKVATNCLAAPAQLAVGSLALLLAAFSCGLGMLNTAMYEGREA